MFFVPLSLRLGVVSSVNYFFFCALCSHPVLSFFFFLMIRRPPRSTLDRSSAASDVYKRQSSHCSSAFRCCDCAATSWPWQPWAWASSSGSSLPVSYTHLRAHETVLDLVCRLLLEIKNHTILHLFYICSSTHIIHTLYTSSAAGINLTEESCNHV